MRNPNEIARQGDESTALSQRLPSFTDKYKIPTGHETLRAARVCRTASTHPRTTLASQKALAILFRPPRKKSHDLVCESPLLEGLVAEASYSNRDGGRCRRNSNGDYFRTMDSRDRDAEALLRARPNRGREEARRTLQRPKEFQKRRTGAKIRALVREEARARRRLLRILAL
ncbi:hypothetical protein KM043_010900 [Ampulex compressa]|nr:hypothetical protein KM043_010900 [Ampulex compressa]